MRNLTFLQSIRDLPAPARKFLLFSCINLVSWQCIVGQVLILFGRAIDMPHSWVGILISFLPLSLLLVVFSMPAVERHGPRRVLIITWLIRNIFAATVFTIPFAVTIWGDQAAWFILLFATLGFSMARAFGVGAWFPWLHEIVPREKRGAYFSIETVISQALTIVLAFGIAQMLTLSETTTRFYGVYFIGVTTGLISILYIKRIPDGRRNTIESEIHPRFTAIVSAFRDRKYRRFILLMIIGMSSIMWINVASILYLRDMLGYSDSTIMTFTAVGAFGITLTIRYWSRHAERFGSHKTITILTGAHSMIAFAWFGILPDTAWTTLSALPVIVAGSIFSAGYSIVASRGMMGLVPLENRVGYTSLWIIGVSIANGIPPILAGKLIDLFQINGFRACFLIAGICGAASALLWKSFQIDEAEIPISDIHLILRPMQPLRSASRMVWMLLARGKKDKTD